MIREADINDAEGIAQVHVDTWRNAYSNIIPAEFLSELSVETRAESWSDQISESNSQIIVYTDKNQILGFLAGGNCRDSDLSDYSEIYAIYVCPKHQSRGIGKMLVEHFIAPLTKSCALWVLQENTPSIGFYQSLGFKCDGTTKKLKIKGDTIEEIRLTQALP